MKLYLLENQPDESAGEGEDWDEWFTSLRAAKVRRRGLIASVKPPETPVWAQQQPVGFSGEDFGIYEVTLVRVSARELVRRALNRRGYVETRVQVVPPARFVDGKRVHAR